MSPRPAYQPDDASARIGAASLAGLLVLGGLGVGVVLALFAGFQALSVRPAATALARARIVPEGPQLEAHPVQDRLALEAPARARLATYGWTDRGKGLAHIPIERAMALQAQKGWPDAEAPKP
jgi:hypothetical protein